MYKNPLTATLLAMSMTLTACGGGGGDSGPAGKGSTPTANWSNAAHAKKCVSPRSSGVDLSTGKPWGDTQGTLTDEKNWVRAWMDDTYLWYDEMPNPDPSQYNRPEHYFSALKVKQDRFSWSTPTAAYQNSSYAGIDMGYGVSWVFENKRNTPPRKLLVTMVDPAAPASNRQMQRGMEIIAIDGVDMRNTDTTEGVATLTAGMYPQKLDEKHVFRVRTPDGNEQDITLTAANVSETTVPIHKVIDHPQLGKVGYLLLTTFDKKTAEKPLVEAVEAFKRAGIKHLIVDLRYNGGGYLNLSAELAYMIGGKHTAQAPWFEKLQHNAKRSSWNSQTPFLSKTWANQGLPKDQPLPTLDLPRVTILSSSATCSASESLINGLRGAGVDVRLVGGSTCGKPYGMYAQDNCGITYASLQFKGVNAKGFGDFAQGFAPDPVGDAQSKVPGCQAQDDYSTGLGETGEKTLAQALHHLQTGTCDKQYQPSLASVQARALASARPFAPAGQAAAGAIVPPQHHLWRENLIVSPPAH